MGRILRVFPFLAFYGVKCSYVSFNNDSSDDNTSRCQDFNSIYWKMRYNRKESCQQAGCDFEGNKWFGKCKSLNVSHDARMNLKAPNSGPNPIYSLLVTKDSSEDVIIAIEGLMKDKFTSTVADSIEKSHEAAHEVAKALVLDVLRETSNIEHVGTILSHIFADETVLKSTRALAYFYLHTNETMDSISYQLNRLRFYYCRGGGKVMSEIELINQFLIWSQQQEFRDILYPILIQTFQHRESVLEPLGIIAADSLKCAQESSSTGLAEVVAHQLKADSTKEYAKNFVSQLIMKRSKDEEKTEVEHSHDNIEGTSS